MNDSRSGRSRVGVMLAMAAVAGIAGWQIHASLGTATNEKPSVAEAPVRRGADASAAVTALGRLEPKDGILRVAGPSQSSVVLSQLLVEKGDRVEAGQIIAVFDSFEPLKAALARLRVELEHAQAESRRHDKLYQDNVVSVSERDAWRMKVDVLQADLHRAQVELDQAAVRAPISAQVLDIHARAGERVGPDGIVELGKTDQMYAIAEVYETDIGRVRVGQGATVTSPALAEPMHGSVERIGLKIGKLDMLDTDPIARTDARVVEAQIRLDDSPRVAGLTNLQVEVAIAP